MSALPLLTIDEIRALPVLHVWHASEPSVAAVFRLSRAHAYDLARRGEFPTVRLGSRVVVPVPALLRMLGTDLAAAS